MCTCVRTTFDVAENIRLRQKEIDALRAENERLREENERLKAEVEKLKESHRDRDYWLSVR